MKRMPDWNYRAGDGGLSTVKSVCRVYCSEWPSKAFALPFSVSSVVEEFCDEPEEGWKRWLLAAADAASGLSSAIASGYTCFLF